MSLLNKYKKIQDQLEIIGNSEPIREVIEQIMTVAPTNISVLITGESGVGKEVFAKAIHELSQRNGKGMISVNMGAIPEGLLESELFGHEKGAFTGAIAQKKGYFELAADGTIFLDEIGEAPLQTQVKLLRVLESGEFMRVGSGELKKVDVRVVAATNRGLTEMVNKGTFRKDLFYRLKSITINIPPLRERRSDIPDLMEHFLKNVIRNNNIEFGGFTEEALSLIEHYSWPGNIRELKNFVESVSILAAGKKVDGDMVREHLMSQEDTAEPISALPVQVNKSVDQTERELIYKALLSLGVDVKEMKQMVFDLNQRMNQRDYKTSRYGDEISEEEIIPIEDMEIQMIRKALIKYQGNKRKVASALNISERTLYRKLKEYELQ